MNRVAGGAILLVGATGFIWSAWLVIPNLLPWLAYTGLQCLAGKAGDCIPALAVGLGFGIALLIGGGLALLGWKVLRYNARGHVTP